MIKFDKKYKYTLANKLKKSCLTFEECIAMLDDWAQEEMTLSAHSYLVSKLIEKVNAEKQLSKTLRKAIQIRAMMQISSRMDGEK